MNDNANETILTYISNIIQNDIFIWICYFIVLILTLVAYLQEPIRFSGVIALSGLSYKYHYFIIACITLFLYLFTFLGLWFSIPFTKNLPKYWYIPIFVLLYGIITQITVNSEIVTDKNKNLNSPPSYILPRNYRYIIYYFIILLDVIIFLYILLQAGITVQYKTTVVHQIFLNRFGGFVKGNILNFLMSWGGLIGILCDIYMIYNQFVFSACKYNLPESWNF